MSVSLLVLDVLASIAITLHACRDSNSLAFINIDLCYIIEIQLRYLVNVLEAHSFTSHDLKRSIML